jgi:hypothetical protein
VKIGKHKDPSSFISTANAETSIAYDGTTLPDFKPDAH